MESKKNDGKKETVIRHSFHNEIKKEFDPDWRKWFLEVERKQKSLLNLKQPVVVSRFEKDGQESKVIRKKTSPERLRKFIKVDSKKTGRIFNVDTDSIQLLWNRSVGAEIASSSTIHSFKNGVLTVLINNSPLLQEIRQFHQDAILHDLRDIWTVTVPLVKIIYRSGKG